MDYRYTAESWDEFIRDLRTRKPLWNGSSVRDEDGSWTGCRNWQHALDYATKGHPVARVAIDSAAIKVTSEPEPQWDTAPVGAFPCIPAYAAGAPEDMFTPSEDAPPVSRPIVRIAVNMVCSAAIPAEDIANRGAAIVTLIDRLQLAGRRVELIALWHGGCDDDKFIVSVTIKRPEEPVDIDRIGLAFATPIMVRRFLFRTIELVVPYHPPGYGRVDHHKDECKQYHMSLPPIKYGSTDYSTPEKAAAAVAKLWEAAAV